MGEDEQKELKVVAKRLQNKGYQKKLFKELF